MVVNGVINAQRFTAEAELLVRLLNDRHERGSAGGVDVVDGADDVIDAQATRWRNVDKRIAVRHRFLISHSWHATALVNAKCGYH